MANPLDEQRERVVTKTGLGMPKGFKQLQQPLPFSWQSWFMEIEHLVNKDLRRPANIALPQVAASHSVIHRTNHPILAVGFPSARERH